MNTCGFILSNELDPTRSSVTRLDLFGPKTAEVQIKHSVNLFKRIEKQGTLTKYCPADGTITSIMNHRFFESRSDSLNVGLVQHRSR